MNVAWLDEVCIDPSAARWPPPARWAEFAGGHLIPI